MLNARNALIAGIVSIALAAFGLSFSADEPQDPPATVATLDDVLAALNRIEAAIRQTKAVPATAQAKRGYTGCIVEVSDVIATLAAKSTCPPCNHWSRDFGSAAVPNGWRKGTTDSDHFKLVQTDGPWPVFRFMRDGQEFHRIVGYHGLEELWTHHPSFTRN